MKELEDGVNHVFSGLSLGVPQTLDVQAQTMLATWAMIRGMMAAIKLGGVPSRSLFREMYEKRCPPDGSSVWMSHCLPPDLYLNTLGLISEPHGDPPRRTQGFVATLVFGYLGFVVFGNPFTDRQIDPPPRLAEHFPSLWPVTREGVAWPPGGTVTTEILDALGLRIGELGRGERGNPLPLAPPERVFPGWKGKRPLTDDAEPISEGEQD